MVTVGDFQELLSIPCSGITLVFAQESMSKIQHRWISTCNVHALMSWAHNILQFNKISPSCIIYHSCCYIVFYCVYIHTFIHIHATHLFIHTYATHLLFYSGCNEWWCIPGGSHSKYIKSEKGQIPGCLTSLRHTEKQDKEFKVSNGGEGGYLN